MYACINYTHRAEQRISILYVAVNLHSLVCVCMCVCVSVYASVSAYVCISIYTSVYVCVSQVQ